MCKVKCWGLFRPLMNIIVFLMSTMHLFHFYFELFCLNLFNKYSQRLMDCVQVVVTIKLMHKEAKKPKRKHKNNHKWSVILEFDWTISQPALSLSTLAMEKVQTLSTCYNLLIIRTFLTPTVCTTYISIYSKSTCSLPAVKL